MSKVRQDLHTAAKESLGAWDAVSLMVEASRAIDALDTDSRLERGFLPTATQVFRAFAAVSPESCRVVVIGQDPYPVAGNAMGLAFSSSAARIPASLRNIFKELTSDLGIPPPRSGDLSAWVAQGVLLANAGLTLGADGRSHLSYWINFTRQWVSGLAASRPLVWVLWGKHAQAWKHLISAAANGAIIIESTHPSPLSARRGFFGSKPFSRVNQGLHELGYTEIDWSRGQGCSQAG